MNKYFLTAVFGFALILAVQTAKAEIQFPVAELGNCADKAACRTFCDIAANFQVCTEFAEKNNLLPQESIQRAKKFVALLKTGGPGNCRTERTCRTYCEDVSHLQACARSARESGIISAQEAERLEKIRALKETDLPGDCTSISTCRAYCANPDHKQECLAFAESAGYLPREEVNRAKQMLLNNAPAIRPRYSAVIMRCIEQSVGKEVAERINAGALRMDTKLETAVKLCVTRLNSTKPSAAPTRTIEPINDRPIISTIPPELLNGGATNLPTPAPEARLHQSIKRHFYLASLLRALFSF